MPPELPQAVPLAALPVPLLLLEPGDDPLVRYANPAFEASFGLAAAAISRLSDWLLLTYPQSDYRRRLLDQWHQAGLEALAGGSAMLQCRVQGGDGEPREVQVLLSPHAGQLLAVLIDVTARRRAEAALEEARASQAATALAITEAIPVGTYTMVMEPDRPVAYFAFMSERFLEITGLDRARARENPLEGFAAVHPDDYDDWLRINAEAFASKQPFKGECRVVVNGQTRWITAESVPRDLPDGSTVWEGVLTDVSERVLAQQALEASEQRLRRLLENLPVPVASMGGAGADQGRLCNRLFVETFGYTAADLRDQQAWMERAYPEPENRARVQEAWDLALAASGKDGALVTAGEFVLRCADGRDCNVLISATRIDQLVVATLLDISERVRSEQALASARQREKQLEEQHRQRLEQKLRTSLAAAAVVHEIDQPLSAVLLNAQLARQRLLHSGQPGLEASEASLNALVEQANQVVSTMHKMRSLLRNVRSEPRPLDLAIVVDSALLAWRPRLEAAGVRLHCDGLDQPCVLSGDAEQLQVAIANLLRNSLEALESSCHPDRQACIAVRLQCGETEVMVSVGDSGPGIRAAVLEALPLQTTKPDGTGIGLYLVQTAVDNHHGRLSFERSSLGGAEVRLHLPLITRPSLAS